MELSIHRESEYILTMTYFDTRTSDPLVKVNSTLRMTVSTLLHRLVLLRLSNVQAIQYKLGPKRLTWPWTATNAHI